MPIDWRENGMRVDVSFSDPYTLPEAEKVMKQIFARPGFTPPLRMLVDVRHSSPPDTEFVGNAITFWQSQIHHMWGAKVAVVAVTDRQLRMGHLSEDTAQSRQLPFTVRVFEPSEVEEAERWLSSA